MLKSDLLTPACWNDYELLDSGNFEKLERFGRYVVARPEPQNCDFYSAFRQVFPPQEAVFSPLQRTYVRL